jgi:hypothetical protein
MLGSADIAFFRHPLRDCAYDEAEALTRLQMDSPESIASMVNQLTACEILGTRV